MSYILCLLLIHNEKSGVCKLIQGGILKPALPGRDYRTVRHEEKCRGNPRGTADSERGFRNARP